MKNLRPEEENIIKDIRNPFRLNEELNYTAIKDIKSLFRPEKKSKAIKDRILRDIKNLFEHEEENYYKPIRVTSFWCNNYTGYESNDDRSNVDLQSVEEYINNIRPYLKDIINNLKKSFKWIIQLALANNFISSTDNDDERVMHSKSDNIEILKQMRYRRTFW